MIAALHRQTKFDLLFAVMKATGAFECRSNERATSAVILNIIAELMTDDSIPIDVQDLRGSLIQVDDDLGLVKDERRFVKTIDYRRGPVITIGKDPF